MRRTHVHLFAPDGSAERVVRIGGPLERTLRGLGWRSTPKRQPAEPSHIGKSKTAARARADLETLGAEAWRDQWGPGLCAALDELEEQADVGRQRLQALLPLLASAIRRMRALTVAWLAWSPTRGLVGPSGPEKRLEAAEVLAQAVYEESTAFGSEAAHGAEAAMVGLQGRERPAAPEGGSEPAGADAARASAILADLAAEIAAGPEPATAEGIAKREEALDRLAQIRAKLGGSNVPPGSGGQIPS